MTFVLKQLLIQSLRKPCIECRRLLFNNNNLGLDHFLSKSNKHKKILGNRKEILIDRLQKNTKDKVEKDDLWQMLYIADTDRDVELCIQMTRRYSHFQKSIPRKSVCKADLNFGPETMRMLHHLRKSDIATMLVKDQDLKELFMHFSTYLIYMDLLYECGKYDQVVEFYFKTMNMKEKEKLIKSNHTTLFMAALYKINTKDSLQKAVDLFHTKCHSENDDFTHRTKAFAAVLALNQGEPELALEIIDLNFASSWKGHFNTSLRMFILCKLNRIEEALMILEDFLFFHEERVGRPRDSAKVFPDCVEAVQEVIDKCDGLQLKQKFSKIKKELQDEGRIHKKTSIEVLNGVILSSRADMAELKEINRKKEKYQQKYNNI